MGARRISLWILLLLVGSVVGWAVAHAATPAARENMTASPTRIKAELEAGSSVTGQVLIINDGDTDYDFRVYTAPYRVSGEDYDPHFVTEPGAVDPSRWIQVPSQVYHVTANQRQAVPYTITVPAGTDSGGYYATVFYETIPKPAAGSGVQSRQRIGVVAYLGVAGGLRRQGSIVSFASHWLQKGQPLAATLRLRNDGNVHYSGNVNFKVTDLLGQTKADVVVSREVLPGTVRRFVLHWDRTPPLGLFRVGGSVELVGRTEPLPAHYVLVLSPLAFWISLGVACALAISALVWWLIRRQRR